jgi:N-acetylglucosaminyl-diphospho-decaprenol L-rhamnosyltransferase
VADLAVIIVSYNSAGYLRSCLESVYAHAGAIELDVVVVDNASEDGSPEFVEAEFPAVRVLRNENRGFAHANNRGFETIDAPFVLFLNPDTEILDGTFEAMLGLFEDRPSVGLLGCRQLTAEGEVFPTIRRFPSATRYLCQAFGAERLPVQAAWMGERVLESAAYERETDCDWVAGSFMLARSEAVQAAGMMDERFFLYSEENDLCRQIQAHGWDVRHVPDMTIFHEAEKGEPNARLEAQDAYSRRQYLFKHERPLRRNLATVALVLYYLRRCVDSVGRKPEARARRAAARVGLRTLVGWDGPPFGELSGPLRGPRVSAGALAAVEPEAVA